MGQNSDEEFFEISAVARLTGLTTHVLRVWEKRYGVVEPDRTDTKRRLYSRDDINRLTLLKSLVDNGHTISSVANLDIRTLEDRLSDVLGSKAVDAVPDHNCRVGFIGIQSRKAVRDASDFAPGFKVIAEFSQLDEIVENVKPGVIDVLIVETGSLFSEDVVKIQKTVDSLSAQRAIVIYQFAGSKVLEPSLIKKITPIRGPVTSSEILMACSVELQIAEQSLPEISVNETEIPARLFTEEQLVAVGKTASVVQCECPQHLGNLLSGLTAFEEYSSRCENLNDADAKLHAFLHQETAQCRLRLERALMHLLETEGIKV